MWTAKLQTVIVASSFLRTLMKDARWGLHSLVGVQSGFPDCCLPRNDRAFASVASKPFTHQRLLNHTVTSTNSVAKLWRCTTIQAGILKASPCCNIAQHMRAFLAAMATTAFQ